jgi:hypothetical protein
MDGFGAGFGAGLAALAFWGFVAAVVVAGVWDAAKKREAQHETLRKMLESSKPVDETLLTRLMVGEPKRPSRDLAIGAIVVFSVAVGLAVLGLILEGIAEKALLPLLGAAALCACIATGLLGASAYVRRTEAADAAQARQRPHAG